MTTPAMEPRSESASVPSSQSQPEQHEVKARVDAVWEKMNKGVSKKTLNSIVKDHSSTANQTPQKRAASQNWMTVLGLGPKKTEASRTSLEIKSTDVSQNGTTDASNDESKKIAAAALAAARGAASSSAILNKGKIEVKEIMNFAGEDIEYKKLIDPNSRDAAEKAKVSAGASSAVDAILDQIKKKPKLSVLDKTKKDWGEFKDENKGLEEELDVYKKSSNQYLDRVSFLERADHRQFELERDARLALQARRRPDMREGP